MSDIDNYLYEKWHAKVDTQYFYRGMSAKDLVDPLDPAHDPFASIRPQLLLLIQRLSLLSDVGFQFTVHEEYSGLSFQLRDILHWTSGDLTYPGLDFTSSHESACGYIQNFQGSQLKQNFKYITDQLPARKADVLLQQYWTSEDWHLVTEINHWMSAESAAHQRVVLWVRRSCPAFESAATPSLLRGRYDFFQTQVMQRLTERNLPYTLETLEEILPSATQHCDIRLTQPLHRIDIERVENCV